MNNMEEFKDACQDLIVRSDEIAADLQELPTYYKLAERYVKIDQEIYEMIDWYEKTRKEKKIMDERMARTETNLRHINNDIQRIRLREFSRARHGELCSRPHQNRHL